MKSSNTDHNGVDNLHIPHIGYHHWIPDSRPERIQASEKDSRKRPISVRFYLEDLRARTNHVYAMLPPKKNQA